MKELLESLNMTCSEFSKEYEIPYNTVLQWKNGIRQAPKYLATLIERLNEEKKRKNAAEQEDIKFLETANNTPMRFLKDRNEELKKYSTRHGECITNVWECKKIF